MLKKIRGTVEKWNSYKTRLKQTSKIKFYIVDAIETVVVAVAMALVIRKFIFQTSLVFSGSMIPTLAVQDRLIVNKVVYRYREPHRGEIILFKSPHHDGKEYVKRLIGMPGEIVELRRGVVFVNNQPLILAGVNVQQDYSYFGPETVPAGSYFVLGDNRGNSSDSRVWGYVPRGDLIGKAEVTFWPLRRVNLLH